MAKIPSLNPLDVWGTYLEAVESVGEFVAGPAPSNPVGAAIHGRMRDQCDDFSANPGNYAFQGPLNNYAMNAHCSPYWEGQGYDGPQESSPGFTGGQCVGTLYNVTATCSFVSPPFPSQDAQVALGSSRRVPGPLTFVGVRDTGSNFVCQVEGGTTRVMAFINGGADAVFSKASTTSVSLSNIVVSPADGCGDPPGGIGPGPNPAPDPGLDPDERFTTDPDGRPILPMPEIPNPFGDPIQLPSIPLPEFGNPAWNPGSQPNDDPSDPGVAGESEDTGEGGEAEGEAPAGEELVGLSVEILETPVTPRTVGNAPGRSLFVGALYVFMGGENGLELQDEGRVLEDGQFFFAERSSTKWKVYASPDYNLRVTPYYREVPE